MQNEKQLLVQLILNPDHFSDEDHRFIDRLTEKYPYSTALHLLKARAYQLETGTLESDFTNLAAIYSPDRTLLFDLLNRPYSSGEETVSSLQENLSKDNPFSEHDHLAGPVEFPAEESVPHVENTQYFYNPDSITPDMETIDPFPNFGEEHSEEPLNLPNPGSAFHSEEPLNLPNPGNAFHPEEFSHPIASESTISSGSTYQESETKASEPKGTHDIFPEIHPPVLSLKEESMLTEPNPIESPIHSSFLPESTIHESFIETELNEPLPHSSVRDLQEESYQKTISGSDSTEKEELEGLEKEELESLEKEWDEELLFEKISDPVSAPSSEHFLNKVSSEKGSHEESIPERVQTEIRPLEGVSPNLPVRQTFLFWLSKTQKGYFLNSGRNSGGVRLDLNQPIRQVGGMETLEKDYQTNIFHLGALPAGNPSHTIEFDLSKKEDQLIEQYLRVDPQHISPFKAEKSDYSVENQVEKASRDSSELVSETLANLYFQQKLYEKAIMAYEKLSLKMPEKKAYFAEIIQKIRSQPF